MPPKIADSLALFDRVAEQFLSRDELTRKLRSDKKLRVKYSADVKTPTLHIGHAVNLWLLRHLQDLGHKIVIVFEDFTARVGDLDGRLDTIHDLPPDEVQKNIELFLAQARMILRFDDSALIEVRRNSEWYGRMGLHDLLDLFSLVTHARLVAKDSFHLRITEERELYIHEMLHPILHGYDCVVTESDLAIVGSDQLFNESMGRLLQEKHKKAPQTIITTKIAPGIDGKLKQSREHDNHISLAHSPRDKFGRVMSIPDAFIGDYFMLYTDLPLKELEKLKVTTKENPRDVKMRLAREIVARYHGPEIAEEEAEWFDNTVSKKHAPDDIPTLTLAVEHMEILDLVVAARPDKSKSDSRRLIAQGGVEYNGKKLTDPAHSLHLRTNDLLKVGKRSWFRIEIAQLGKLETERLLMHPTQIQDVDLFSKYIPEWEMVRYLGKLGAKARIGPALTQDIFKRILFSAEPRHEWLWTITDKNNPDTPLGIAHLRRDAQHGSHNIWLAPDLQGSDGITREAMEAVSNYAFQQLGFRAVTFKEAFAFANAPREGEALYNAFRALNDTQLNADLPDGAFGFTREGWEKLQEWRQKESPWMMKKKIELKPERKRFRAQLQRLKDKEAADAAHAQKKKKPPTPDEVPTPTK